MVFGFCPFFSISSNFLAFRSFIWSIASWSLGGISSGLYGALCGCTHPRIFVFVEDLVDFLVSGSEQDSQWGCWFEGFEGDSTLSGCLWGVWEVVCHGDCILVVASCCWRNQDIEVAKVDGLLTILYGMEVRLRQRAHNTRGLASLSYALSEPYADPIFLRGCSAFTQEANHKHLELQYSPSCAHWRSLTILQLLNIHAIQFKQDQLVPAPPV